MIYKDDENPFDMNLLTNIAEHFQSVRPKYVQYEGSMRGVDINMLLYQVPGGMLSILEKQLVDLNKQHRLKDLIDEIPRIRRRWFCTSCYTIFTNCWRTGINECFGWRKI